MDRSGPAGTLAFDVHADPPPAAVSVDNTPPLALPVDPQATTPTCAVTDTIGVPGYEVLGILGRGGMGVVYKALQINLKRVVALKMIVSGAHASPAELGRFRTEAEAVARLQHPNIVQIYEVGEQNALPYFSLEYVDGGSLAAKLGSKPLPAHEAAEIMHTLARAMHHCHQRGIVHRDLKPANVLLTQDGQPKITDFGLAKQLETDLGQTRSGAVLGTPSYMAPEQATGKIKEIGPLTDVYALGAVLFEMLTGRPPFRGETSMETLLQVVNDEPPPPSRHHPHLPHDLETICLKALAKEPTRRYQSALALAQDLERFLAGEPIVGRRERVAARLWRKARRSPVTAASLVGVVLAVALTTLVLVRGSDSSRRAAIDRQAAERQKQINERTQAFEAGLNAEDWTPAHLARMDRLLTDLQQVAPDEAAAGSRRLKQRFADVIRDSFSPHKKPVLEPADVTRIGASLDLLQARDPERARVLRGELGKRIAQLDVVFDLGAASNRLDTVLPPGYQLNPDKKSLTSQYGGNALSVVPTKVACQGDVELEGTFAQWGHAPQIGFALHTGTGLRNGYSFLLTPPTSPGPRLSLDAARQQTGGLLTMHILHNGVRLREQSVRVPADGPLLLRAIHKGERLTFQVKFRDALTTLDFAELYPYGEEAGVFALYWPSGVQLTSLKASRQALPALPSPLQRGDDFYLQGRFDDAIAAYRATYGNSADREIRQEARCKEALCLDALKRTKEAAPIYAEVAAEQGPRWPIVATTSLWLILANEHKFTEADVLCQRLARHPRSKEVALLIPDNLRDHIRNQYRARIRDFTSWASIYTLIRHDPERPRDLERALAVEKFFESSPGTGPGKLALRIMLVRGYHVTNQLDTAVQNAEALLAEAAVLAPWQLADVLQEYTCLMIRRGQPEKALAELNRRLGAQVPFNSPYRPLLLERARAYAALKEWDKAAKDLDDLIKVLPANDPALPDAYLMRGFLQERAGDADGAVKTWKQGWTKIKGTNAIFALTGSMLGALADELTEADMQKFINNLVSGVMRESPFAAVIKNDLLPPPFVTAVSKERYRNPRGRDYARRIAFHDVTIPEAVSALFCVTIFEAFHQGAVKGNLSEEQDVLMWKLTNDVFAGYAKGNFTEVQGFQFAQAWLGTTGLLGWGGLKGQLEPSIRGPLAYVLGHRYLELRKPQDAAAFFTTAVGDTPKDSPLQRLAQAELDRIKEK